MRLFATLTLLVGTLVPSTIFAVTADELVRDMDTALAPSNFAAEYYFMNIRTDGTRVEYRIRVQQRDEDHVHMYFDAPERERGREIVKRGDDMWTYSPSVGRVMRLQDRESFAGGDFSNEDVMRGDLVTDYTASIVSETDNQWVLDLVARSGAAYAKIRIWVSKANRLPVQEYFYDSSGTLMKRVVFGSVRRFGSISLPTRAVMENVITGQRSEWRINSLTPNQTFADSLFASSSMGRN